MTELQAPLEPFQFVRKRGVNVLGQWRGENQRFDAELLLHSEARSNTVIDLFHIGGYPRGPRGLEECFESPRR